MSKFIRNYYERVKGFDRNIHRLLLAEFLISIGITFWLLLFNLYLQEAGYGKASIGNVLMVSNIAMALCALPAGYLAGKYNHKILLIIGRVVATFGFVGMMCVLEKAGLFALVFIAFASAGCARVVCGPFIMANSKPEECTYIFSINFIIMLGCGAIWNGLGGTITESMTSMGFSSLMAYRYTIISGVAVGALGIIPLLRIKMKPSMQEEGRIKLSEIGKWNWIFFIKSVLPAFIGCIGAGIIVQFMNLYFENVFNSPDRSIGYYLSIQSIAMAVGILMSPLLAEKIGKVNTIVTTQLISIPFILILAFTDRIELAVFAFVIRATFMNMAIPIYDAFILGLCKKEEQGIVNAFFMIAWSFSWAIAARLFGNVFQGDYKISFMVAGCFYLASAILFYIIFRNTKEKTEDKKEASLSTCNTNL